MFEAMPSIAAVTMLTKLQSDVRQAEGEVLHSLIANIDMKDIRVNELNAYVLPEATTLFPGQTFRSNIFMAAVDTTQRPEIYVNGRRIADNGTYSFTAGGPGEYSFSGHIIMRNNTGETIRRNFTQRYNVLAPPSGATVAADLMNVLYAGFENPVSVSASGIPADKISLSMTGGQLTPHGKGKYTARPSAVGQDVIFTVTGEVGGKRQTMGTFAFKVRKLPDPTAYIAVGTDRFKGGRLAKGSILGAQEIGAAIDDGLHGQLQTRNIRRLPHHRRTARTHTLTAPRGTLLHIPGTRSRPRRHRAHTPAASRGHRELTMPTIPNNP